MAAPMPVGMFELFPSSFGLGPGNDAVGPLWSASISIPQLPTIEADIVAADAANVLWGVNLADSPGNWTNPVGGKLIFSPTKYENQIRRWTVAGGATSAQAAALTSAFTRRRLAIYLFDEPSGQQFGGSLNNDTVNQMGLLVKSIWPGVVVIVSAEAGSFSMAAPPGGWTGLDYASVQFNGKFPPAYMPNIGRNFETFAQLYAREKADLAAMGLGMIPSINLTDGGLTQDNPGFPPACWDYLNTGVSSGYVVGTFANGTVVAGSTYACGTLPAAVQHTYASPAMLTSWADAVANDPDAPAAMLWHHARSNFNPNMIPFESQSNIVTALDYIITKCNARPVSNGWRPIKGAPGGGGGGQVSTKYAYAEQIVRQTSTADTYVNISGAALASTQFTAGRQYLIHVTAYMDYNSVTKLAYARLLHGTTPWTESEMIWQPGYNTERRLYNFWTVWTAVAGEGIQLQMRQETGNALTIGANAIGMFALDLTGLPAGSWQFNESAASTALTTVYQDGALSTFTPGTTGHNWLVLTEAQYSSPSDIHWIISGLRQAGGAVATDPEVQSTWWGAQAARLQLLTTAKVLALTNVAQTFAEESKINIVGGGPRINSKVFALDLSTFGAHAFAYTNAELDYANSSTKFQTLAQSVSITPSVQAPVWVLGSYGWVAGTPGIAVLSRLAIDGARAPALDGNDDYGFDVNKNGNDISAMQHQVVKTLSAVAHPLRLEASQQSPAAGRGGKGRLLMAVQMSATVAPPVPPATPDQALEALQRLDLTFVASDPVTSEPNLTYSAVSALPSGAVFDPITRRLVWVPTLLQVGDYTLTFRVSNGTLTADWSFVVHVTLPAGAISIPPTDITNNLRFDTNIQGGRIVVRVSWNAAGSFLTAMLKQGISGIVVEMSDLNRRA